MTISISNLIVKNNASAGTTIGVLTAQDASGNAVDCDFSLTKDSAGYFSISGNDLVTAWDGSPVAGNYSARVRAVGTNTWFSGNASFTIGVEVPAPPPPTGQPASGVTGYTLALEYAFGTTGNVKNIGDLESLFTPDAPWGRINGELQTFQPFNKQNHVFAIDNLALVGLADGSANYAQYGHIASGALVSKVTCFAPCIVEIVAMLPAGRGVWPSLWLYDTHSGMHDSSEIDIMESQFNAPVGQRDDRSLIYQNDHGPGLGATLSNPGKLDQWARWAPYGAMPGGNMSARYAAYSVHWQSDRVTKYVDDKPAVTREFRWTGPAEANILLYNSIGSATMDWPGPVLPATFTGDNAKFRINAIRIFKPSA